MAYITIIHRDPNWDNAAGRPLAIMFKLSDRFSLLFVDRIAGAGPAGDLRTFPADVPCLPIVYCHGGTATALFGGKQKTGI
jgi:hypothetical protein